MLKSRRLSRRGRCLPRGSLESNILPITLLFVTVLGSVLFLSSYIWTVLNVAQSSQSLVASSTIQKSQSNALGSKLKFDDGDLTLSEIARYTLGLFKSIRFSYSPDKMTLYDVHNHELASKMCQLSSRVKLFESQWNHNHMHEFIMNMHDPRNREYHTLMGIHTRTSHSESKPLDLSRYNNCCHVLNVKRSDMDEMQLPKMTVVINTWQREHCLVQSIKKWTQLNMVDNIIVVSGDIDTKTRWQNTKYLNELYDSGLIKINGKSVYIHSGALESDKLSDRFQFDPHIMNDVILSIDDDLILHPRSISDALRLYVILNQGRIENRIAVALDPAQRMIPFPQTNLSMGISQGRSYIINLPGKGTCVYNSAFLTHGGIMHKEYFLAFQNDPRMKPVREMIDELNTGEDIAMSLLYSSMHNGLPPVIALSDFGYKLLNCPTTGGRRNSNRNIGLTKMHIANLTAQVLGFGQDGNHNSMQLRNFSSYIHLDRGG